MFQSHSIDRGYIFRCTIFKSGNNNLERSLAYKINKPFDLFSILPGDWQQIDELAQSRSPTR